MKKIEYIIFSDDQINNEVNIMTNNVKIETKIKNELCWKAHKKHV